MTKLFTPFIALTTLLASFALTLVMPAFATTPAVAWDTTGDYIVSMEYQGTDYAHDMTLVQAESGDLTGDGGSPAGAQVYRWSIESGNVIDNTINFTADYSTTSDAVTPQTTITATGIIAANGSMSGTWSDNYAGNNRAGTWRTTSGTATEIAPVENTNTISVTITKYINGTMATASTADTTDFPMTAAWSALNTGAGTGSYTLYEGSAVPYQAMTAEMTKGADYATSETLTNDVVGLTCAEAKPFALFGYTTGNTMEEAQSATPSMTMPSFTNLQTDKYVIVWNTDCALPGGEIGGEVVGNDGELLVTSIEMIDTSATANGSFADGWKYVFHITAPVSEPKLSLKFNNWLQTNGSDMIPVSSNMRISSLQANNANATILLTAENTYADPDLYMTSDLDPNLDGRQVEVLVEVAVPTGTANGSYSTAYGVRSNP